MQRITRSVRFEQLEARDLKAGDVTAAVSNGDLYLTEATNQPGFDNAVLISQLANGKIRVTGKAAADGTLSKINGASFQDFTVPGSLNVNFGAGNDLVVIGSELGVTPPSFNAVTINTAAPPLNVSTQSLVGTNPFTRADRDNVIIWGMNTRGSVSIKTGDDNDWVYVSESEIGDDVGVDNISINTGSGADTAQIGYSVGLINGAVDIQTYGYATENDADVVWLDEVYAKGNITARTGAGNDLIHMFNSTSYKDMSFDAGTGDDTGDISDVCAVDNFMAQMGDGNDMLTLNNLYTIHGATKLDGGAGADQLIKKGASPTLSLEQINWEWVNGRRVIGVIGSSGNIIAQA